MTSPNPHAIDTDTLSGMKPLRKVVYSIGSNLGDRQGNLQGAVDALRDTPDVIVVDVSPVYETSPVGGPEDSPDFLNLVVVAETTLEPRTLLERALAIERNIDLDRVWAIEDLVQGDDAFFAATGITDGELLDGVHYGAKGATTHSLAMRATSGTVRYIQSTHRLEKLETLRQMPWD